MKLPITAVLIGAGRRGFEVYGNYILKYRNKLNIIAVAEPIKKRRESHLMVFAANKSD